MGTEHSPCFFVGEEAEHQIACRLGARPCEMPNIGQDHCVHVLHVDRAAPPDAAITHLRGEGIHLPVDRARRHHIQVSVDGQPGTASVRTLNTDKNIGAPGCALDIPRVEPDLGELRHHVLGAGALPRAGTIAVVTRVDPDQITADADNFGLGSQDVRHGLKPSWRFGG